MNLDNDPGFRRFCADGDRMLREKQKRFPPEADRATVYELPASTKDALDWLKAFHPERLKSFALNRSEAEREAMREHLRRPPEKRKEI